MPIEQVKQKGLFGVEPAPWEFDDVADRLVAQVVFNRPVDQVYDYVVPDRLRRGIAPGKQVLASLGKGKRPVRGYCVGVVQTSPRRELKPLAGVLDEHSLLSPTMLELTRWMADYYLCSWGQVLEAVLPAAVKNRAGTRLVQRLRVSEKVRQQADELRLPPKQSRVFQVLCQSAQPLTVQELARLARCTFSPIQALRRRGLVETVRQRVARFEPTLPPPEPPPQFELNADQRQALGAMAIIEALASGTHRTLLLYGITGSGKTEIYIRAIQEVVSYGRQAIVLVPEISLTPQTIQRFRARFSQVAVLHSQLSDAERHWHWQRIAAGAVSVVVGARSAIFAPTPHLGLIVLDEEHESTFKQETTPRYHARDVALKRTEMEGIPLVLGSATPSLESWQAACEGRFQLIRLPQRVLQRPLPTVSIVDLRQETSRRRTRHALSQPLEEAVRRALDEGGQIILLLNRRGFSTHIQCPRCGHAVKCPHCDIALTHHRDRDVALCHYCDFETRPPAACPQCQFPGLRYQGIGTQRLESEVKAKFPQYPCVRMDTDTMRSPGSHDRALSAFRRGEVRILLGTQMIAKGLDFPNVTLVGVINADTALHLPDFRAAERTFQLVAQVAGRTGRGPSGGRVLMQTFSPDHPAVAAAAQHDFLRFAQEELPHRQRHGYPPFGRMARVIVRGPKESEVRGFACQVVEHLQHQTAGEKLAESTRPSTAETTAERGIRILGPAPAPIAKLQNHYRYHIQIQADRAEPIQNVIRQTLSRLRPGRGVEWTVDIDPLQML